MPEKLQAMKDTFTMQATENKVFPIGGAFYTSALHPEEIRASTLTEWTFFPGQVRIPESMAPKFVSGFSSRAIIEANVPAGRVGRALSAWAALPGGFTVYMDEGALCAEYNTLGVYRYKARSEGPIPTGDVKIEVELVYRGEETAGAGGHHSACKWRGGRAGAGGALGAGRLHRLGDLRHRHRSGVAGLARLSRRGRPSHLRGRSRRISFQYI